MVIKKQVDLPCVVRMVVNVVKSKCKAQQFNHEVVLVDISSKCM